jgi:hypothetical protein
VALRDDALAIAVEYNCAVCDAAYLALAMFRAPDDHRRRTLVRSLAAPFPVRWMGALAAVSS